MIEKYKHLSKKQKVITFLIVSLMLITTAGLFANLQPKDQKIREDFVHPTHLDLKVIIKNIVYFLIKQTNDSAKIYANPETIKSSQKYLETAQFN